MNRRDLHPMAELAHHEVSPLDDAARARIKAAIRRDGPRVVARARTVRRVQRAAVGVAPVVVLALGLAWWSRGPARACEGFGPETAAFTRQGDDSAVLELARARILASPGAEVQVESLESCRLVVHLARGRVHVHARALGGGELTVTAPGGAARVVGTVFAVEQRDDRFSVEVAEGVVEVTAKQRPAKRLTRGQQLRGDELRPLSLAEVAPVQAVVDAPRWPSELFTVAQADPAVAEPDPTPKALAEPTGPGATEPGMVEGMSDRAAAPEIERGRGRRTTSRAERRAAQRSRADRASRGGPDGEDEPPSKEDRPAEVGPGEPRSTPPLPESTPPIPKVAPALAPGPSPSASPAPALQRPGSVESPEELVERGDACRRAGDLDCARGAYKKAGGLAGPTAEAAWLALARMELSLGRGEAARSALEARRLRFGQGQLDVEAAWLMVRAHAEAGDDDRAQLEAKRLTERWPGTPQAAAAERWLKEHGAP